MVDVTVVEEEGDEKKIKTEGAIYGARGKGRRKKFKKRKEEESVYSH